MAAIFFVPFCPGYKYQTIPVQAMTMPPITSSGVWTRAITRPIQTANVNTSDVIASVLFFVVNHIARVIAIVNSAWSEGNPGLFRNEAPASTPNCSNGLRPDGWNNSPAIFATT